MITTGHEVRRPAPRQMNVTLTSQSAPATAGQVFNLQAPGILAGFEITGGLPIERRQFAGKFRDDGISLGARRLQTRDTADWEVCATLVAAPPRRRRRLLPLLIVPA